MFFKNKISCRIAVILIILLFMGCSIIETIKTTAKPQTIEESIIYATSNIDVLRYAASIVGADSKLMDDKAYKGLMLYVTSKLIGPILQEKSNLLLMYRNKELGFEQALEITSPDVENDELANLAKSSDAHKDVIKVNEETTKFLKQIEAVKSVADLKDCKLVIGRTSVPCDGPVDAVISAYIVHRKFK